MFLHHHLYWVKSPLNFNGGLPKLGLPSVFKETSVMIRYKFIKFIPCIKQWSSKNFVRCVQKLNFKGSNLPIPTFTRNHLDIKKNANERCTKQLYKNSHKICTHGCCASFTCSKCRHKWFFTVLFYHQRLGFHIIYSPRFFIVNSLILALGQLFWPSSNEVILKNLAHTYTVGTVCGVTLLINIL